MTEYVGRFGLSVADNLCRFVEEEVTPGTGLDTAGIWSSYADLLRTLEPERARLLAKRNRLQAEIDTWFLERSGQLIDPEEHESFLREIGYLVEDRAPLSIKTRNVDPEISQLAGPQLVVPVMNARFALNAANARWGSLYDALYGTDAIAPVTDGANSYDAARGAQVIARAQQFLDDAFPLAAARHADVTEYKVEAGHLTIMAGAQRTDLMRPEAFVGSAHRGSALVVLLEHNGLHVELVLDHSLPAGQQAASGLADIILEAALTTIQDCEDSVAAVDSDDKVAVYRNWLGLMRGDLVESFRKGEREVVRRLASDRVYAKPKGGELVLPGRSLMLVRNVGHLMGTDAVLDANGNETSEGFLDALVTVLAAIHDLRKTGGERNSRSGSIYVVKPKMHGPEEVALTDRLFSRVEDILGLPRHTVKIGVMDEERRTSINLRACMRAVDHRLVFINTGFLDRTGDEIHTAMRAGPVVPKAAMRATRWLKGYETSNVEHGLDAGLVGHGQIGKGMWAKPDAMAEMLATKIDHPRSGATTAWVPSPTAATLHAMHYHLIDVRAAQNDILSRPRTSRSNLLEPPLLRGQKLSSEQVKRDLENNAQSILGYVVRWINQGIGCSKVPDIDNVALMEDRATLRISSQHIANWLLHGLVGEGDVREVLARMAAVVDAQNAVDPSYLPMGPALEDSIAFQAACDLIFDGLDQPNGYTEPILHRRRREAKARSHSSANV